MKFIIAFSLLFASASSFATENAVEALKEIFNGGVYIGNHPSSHHICSLRVQYVENRAIITATDAFAEVKRTVISGTNFRFNIGRREFLSSDSAGTFRTLAVDETLTYTVTARPIPNGGETAVECVIPTEE